MRRIGRFQLAAAITRRARFAGFDRIRGTVHIVEHSAIFRAGSICRSSSRLTRWRCRNEQCERRIFAERIPGLPPFSRRTTRLAGIVRLFGHSVGGRPSERLLARLGRACQDFRVWPELLNIFRSLPL